MKLSPSRRSVFKLNSPVHTHSTVSIRIHSSAQGCSAIKCVQSMCHKVRDGGGKYSLLLLLRRHVGLFFGKRLNTNLLRHRIQKYRDSPVHTLSDSFRIDCFSTLESGWEWTEDVSGKHVAYSSMFGYVCAEPKQTTASTATRTSPNKRFTE